jgi:hypothetical protein
MNLRNVWYIQDEQTDAVMNKLINELETTNFVCSESVAPEEIIYGY